MGLPRLQTNNVWTGSNDFLGPVTGVGAAGAAAASALTGTTLAPNVVASSLLSAAGGVFGTAAYTAAGAYDAVGAAASAQAACQPVDTDLSAIAALATTAYGRALLTMADAAATRSALALGTLATQSGTFSGASSGTNTGDQNSVSGNAGTVTTNANLTGEVTSIGNAATITAAAVTLAKMANMATASLIYRKTAASGVPEVNTLATLKTDLGLTGSNSGDQTIALTGGVTGSGSGSFAATVVTNANLTGDVTSVGNATTVKASVSLTTPVIGAATGTSLAVTGALTSSGTAGIGYATGAGGTITQQTNRTTGVTLSKLCGAITTNTTSLAALAAATFTVTNTLVAATDVVNVCIKSGATNVKTDVRVTAVAAGSFNLTVHNIDATTAEIGAIVINFVVHKAVAA